MQVAFGICVLMNTVGVSLPIEWGKCCVLTFSFCPNGLLFVLDLLKKKKGEKEPKPAIYVNM